MHIDANQLVKLAQVLTALTATNETSDQPNQASPTDAAINGALLGKYVIVRTYSAGVFAGTLSAKDGNEVLLKEARRLWFWKAPKGKSISLSAVAVDGIDHGASRIPNAVETVWLEAIEIIPTTDLARQSIEGAPVDEQN